MIYGLPVSISANCNKLELYTRGHSLTASFSLYYICVPFDKTLTDKACHAVPLLQQSFLYLYVNNPTGVMLRQDVRSNSSHLALIAVLTMRANDHDYYSLNSTTEVSSVVASSLGSSPTRPTCCGHPREDVTRMLRGKLHPWNLSLTELGARGSQWPS